MATREAWASKWDELWLLLRRRFWRPLRSAMDIFHVLPLVTAAILFVLLATDVQFRELYIAALEGARSPTFAWTASIVMAFAVLTLISAALYESHSALSALRINFVYSSYSDPAIRSSLRSLQQACAFILAFLPWLGLSVGLFGARNFVADRYCHLLNSAGVTGDALEKMQYLPIYGGYKIACAIIFLGFAVAYFVNVGEQHRMAQRVVACVALPVAALLFSLFTDWFNIKHRATGAIIAAILIVAFTIAYYLIYQWLYRRRSGFILSNLSSRSGTSLRKRKRHWLAMWAFMPWLALAIYFVCAQYLAGPVQFAIDWRDCPAASYPTPGRWAIFPVAMCVTIALGLIVGHTLGRLSTQAWRRPTVWVLIALVGLALGALSFFPDVGLAVSFYRFIGPLGTVFLQLLFLISIFAMLAMLSRRSGFPALTLVALTVVISVMFPEYARLTAFALAAVYLVFAIAGFLSRQYAVGIVGLMLPIIVWINWQPVHSQPTRQNEPSAVGISNLALKTRFECWLAFRGVASVASGDRAPDCSAYGTPPPIASRTGNYPVFIIAAEGGGIYAASAASMMLAKLQGAVPGFSKHVFAISGVSGGSIGAAIFRALDHPLTSEAMATTQQVQSPSTNVWKMDDATTCAQYPPMKRRPSHQASAKEAANFLESEVAAIMQADHFSPVVGSIVPEKFLRAPLTRAKALVASFDYSTSEQDVEAGTKLCEPFIDSWSPSDDAPALVLNSTWAETGFRVAFAPFDLHATDEFLYSFSDVGMPDVRGANLMSAAAVSARFPFIMPPFSVVLENKDKNNTYKKRWNFLDGGYLDSSGAGTAIDIYRTIRATPNIDLHIILITSTVPVPNLKDDSINGTVFRDTMAPLQALMKVRYDLGEQAVGRACSDVYPSPQNAREQHNIYDRETNAYCLNQSWKMDGSAPLQIVEIQDQTYGLALGWKISATSFAVVEWMLGTPNACDIGTVDTFGVEAPHAATAEDPNAQLTKTIVRRNSCVLAAVAKLVRRAEGSL